MTRIAFITGTGTGVGKTVFTAALARHLSESGLDVAVCKPLASGDRSDARLLARALGGRFPLDVVNPWHFSAPLTPMVAARHAGRQVSRDAIINHGLQLARGRDWLLVEGAGGFFSPLCTDGDAPELIRAWKALPVAITANALGMLHHVEALLRAAGTPLFTPPAAAWPWILRQPPRATTVSRTNPGVLHERHPELTCIPWPHLANPTRVADLSRPLPPNVRAALDACLVHLSGWPS